MKILIFNKMFHSFFRHINFAKARQLAQKLKEFAIWKDVECPYAKTPIVTEFLQMSTFWSEKG